MFHGRWKSNRKLARFCTRLAGLLRSGLSLHTSLNLMYQQSSKEDGRTLKDVIEKIESGIPLSIVFQQHKFHPMVPAMVLVGEESGNFIQTFTRLGEYYWHKFEWKQKMISSLIYPAVVASVMITVTIFVLYSILPRFESMYLNLGFALPSQTETLFAFTSQLRKLLPWIGFISILLGLLPFLMKRMILSRYPHIGTLIFILPGIKKLYRMWNSYRLADSIAVLTASGVPMLNTLEICERIARFSLERKVVQNIKAKILQGDTLTEALRAQFWIDPLLVHAIHAAEASGDLAGICSFTAKEFEGDLQQIIQRLVQLVEPMIILVLGVMISFIVLAVVMPMMEMVQSI